MVRADIYDVEQLDQARARFAELTADATPRLDPLRIPPNAAIPTLHRVARLIAAGELDALRALVTDDFRFDDRSRRSLVCGGVEEWLRALKFLVTETGSRCITRPGTRVRAERASRSTTSASPRSTPRAGCARW